MCVWVMECGQLLENNFDTSYTSTCSISQSSRISMHQGNDVVCVERSWMWLKAYRVNKPMDFSSEGRTGECTPERVSRNNVLEGTLSPVYIHEGNQSCES